jgi:hypothetical protein
MAQLMASDMDKTYSINQLSISIVLALTAGWGISTLVFSAGGKVTSTDKDITYLTGRVDAIEKDVRANKDKFDTESKSTDEEMTKLSTQLDSLKTYVDSVEASKNITISMPEELKKKLK